MKSLAELAEMRRKAREEMSARTAGHGRRVVVGMATCGIAAGARTVMGAMLEDLRTRGLADIPVTMTGCIGVCRLEPIVEVYEQDGTKTTYVRMDPAKARRLVAEHLVNGRVCQDLTIGAVEAN